MRFTLSILSVLVLQFAFAQKPDLSKFKNMKARSIGPAGMSGRVTSIDALHTNSDVILLGTASGGVWKTINGGSSWTPIFDEQPTLNIGAVAIQQSNPAVLWAGTGEGNPRNSLNIGEGIFKSIDGGKTWKLMGLEKTRNIHRILIDPTNPETVYAAAIGNPFDEHPERGVYKTTNGGETWNKILYTNDTSGCAELVMDPANPNKLIANMWQHRRTPWSFTSGGKGSGMYMTMDGGKSWKKLGKAEGLPDGNYGRIGLSFAHSDSRIIYALVEATKNGLYRTEDGGLKWDLVNSDPAVVTNRPFYFQDIRVDTKNENRVYNINQMISLSEDGGRTFKTIVPYSGIHPDHHAFWINPLDANIILDGNDGGIGISRDRGKTWKFDDQLPVGQFYHINVDNELPYNVMGGMQDNGTWRGPAYLWSNGGIRNYYWDNVGGGDGFDVMADPEDANWVYSMSQEGNLYRYNVKTGEGWAIKPPAPDLTTQLRFNWNSALAIDPFDPKTIYYGSQFVHKSNNKGLTWQTISPDLTTNNKVYQKQDENGGLSIDITGAENYTTILAIAPSTKDRNVIWVGTDDGLVQLTRDGGKSWTKFSNFPGVKAGAWVPQIQPSKYNAAEAFVVVNDYRRGDFAPYIFKTTDYGKSWNNIATGKNLDGYALCFLQDPTEPNLVFVGTEHGLWVSFDNAANFQRWTHGYPPVSTYDMVLQEREADLVIATFGRAIYILDDIRPLRELASKKGQPINKLLTVFDAPQSHMIEFRQAKGYDWSSYGLFQGANRGRGANYTYYVNYTGRDTSSKAKLDTATVKIYNDRNEVIRTMRLKVDTGYNRSTWYYEMKGIRQPGSQKPKPDAAEPFGFEVFPGTYKLVMTLGKESDSTTLVVNPAPSSDFPKEIYNARMQMLQRLNKSIERLTEVTDRLNEADESIAKFQAQLKDVEGKDADSVRKTAKAMTDSVKSIREFIFGKRQEKQGYGTVDQVTVNGKLQEARGALTNKPKVPDAQEENIIQMAEKLVSEAVRKSNDFFNGKWKTFRSQAEAIPVKIFKDYPSLTL